MTTPPTPTPASVPPARRDPPTMLRPALALLAGLGITVLFVGGGVLIATLAALRGQDPRHFTPPFGYYVTNLVLSLLGSAAGGFATSRITATRTFFTVLVLALILLMSGVAPVLRGTAGSPGQPDWYPLSLAILGPAGVLLGGALERRRAWAGQSAAAP